MFWQLGPSYSIIHQRTLMKKQFICLKNTLHKAILDLSGQRQQIVMLQTSPHQQSDVQAMLRHHTGVETHTTEVPIEIHPGKGYDQNVSCWY